MVVPPTPMPHDSKPQLRRYFRDARRCFVAGLSKVERDALHRDLARMVAPVLAGFVLPASYAAIGDEIDPVVIEQAFTEIALPRVDGFNLRFHSSRGAALVAGVFGIPEPPIDAPQVRPDLVLVPVLAVTLAGVRLGHGKGFYDRALAAFSRTAPVRSVALAWDCQIADSLSADPWDFGVDFIATPTRLVDCQAFR